MKDVLECQNRNFRAAKLKAFFGDDDGSYDPNLFNNRFLSKSTWEPPNKRLPRSFLNTLSKISDHTNLLVSKRLIHRQTGDLIKCKSTQKNNLSPSELTALHALKARTDLIIKPADKGGAVVCMSPTLYNLEGIRQLHNTDYYEHIDQRLCNDTVPRINSILERISDKGLISKRQLDYLSPSIPKYPRSFYLLPKVHKPRSKWPNQRMPEGRPIVSDCGSETDHISEFIDFFLNPLATNHPSYLKDTYDFLDKIRDKEVPQNSFIVTGDVTGLYTNMNIDRSINVVREAFASHPNLSRPDEEIIELLDIALKCNDFCFNNELFLQKCGTAMGKRFAPNLANLYLLAFDNAACTAFAIHPSLFFRFIDDIFFIWTGTKAQLIEYGIFLNTLIPGIKVTLNIKSNVNEFLDTTIYKQPLPNGTALLKSKVFFKPTDTHQLLHGSSCHPRHTTKGILKSQFIRFKRLCSTELDFNYACKTLYSVLKTRGYSRSLFRRLKRFVWSNTFNFNSTRVRDSNLFPIVNFFDPLSSRIMTHLKDSLSSLPLFKNTRIVKAFKIHKNLRKHLIKSSFTL